MALGDVDVGWGLEHAQSQKHRRERRLGTLPGRASPVIRVLRGQGGRAEGRRQDR